MPVGPPRHPVAARRMACCGVLDVGDALCTTLVYS